MTFSEFKKSVSKIEKIELFGEKAHMEMSPNFRTKELRELDVVKKNPRKAAVLALFYPDKNDNTYIVLILRKTYKGVHSAQIGFPGGKVELTDKDLEETAIRETYEEVGVHPENINILKKLTKIYIPPSNFWVYPFIGTANHTPNFVRQETEVEKIVEVKLEDFLNESSLVEKRLSTSYAKDVDVPAFLLNGHVVWGATAMMLSEVKMVLKNII
ncbi:CoA pyrophosphatase [Mesonia sp. MT50]|uniref:CoA pyrophosphatase n=1 Tax=Mesonia profundi TaxID=3070998 RepID=A0ABU1A3B9_9FLAO|nr:CoA pyrophosphatase [Mesonia profundi]MDQ7917751.1 CoA pyrophosphatase [Mesonia profundi]